MVNRNDDNTFINEKMKIRPDPNKSIFRTSPNSAFFNQGKKNKEDIIVMAKGDPIKYDYSQINNDKINTNNDNNEINNEQNYIKQKPNVENNININNNIKESSEKKINNKYKKEIKTKYVRNKEKINEKNNYSKNNNNNNKKVDSIMINKLLLQMNDLSVKQLSLIDVMENIQTSATQKIKDLNDKIFSLDSLVDDLTQELNELKSQNY